MATKGVKARLTQKRGAKGHKPHTLIGGTDSDEDNQDDDENEIDLQTSGHLGGLNTNLNSQLQDESNLGSPNTNTNTRSEHSPHARTTRLYSVLTKFSSLPKDATNVIKIFRNFDDDIFSNNDPYICIVLLNNIVRSDQFSSIFQEFRKRFYSLYSKSRLLRPLSRVNVCGDVRMGRSYN